MSRRRCNRRPPGFILFILLVLLAVATVMVANAARILILENRQAEQAEDRQQAEWLAESALERAGARLVVDRDYQGETWQVSATELGRPATAEGRGGTALIKVETVADRPNARQVRVTADFPAGAETQANANTHRASKQIVFELATGKPPETGQSPPGDKASHPSKPSPSTFVAEIEP